MEKVLVIGPFNEEMKNSLARSFDDRFELEYITSKDEYGRLADADYVILRTLTLDADDIGRMGRVKLIQRWGVGFDTVDTEAAGKKGIPVAITYGMNSTPVSEMAIALTLAVYRSLVPMTEEISEGKWNRETYAQKEYTIFGKTVGIIGIGNIGKKAAALFQAFGADVIYYDPFRLSPEKEEELGVKYYPLEDIWGECDIISLHAPAAEGTYHIVNAESLARMKDGAVLINTAREDLIDMDALVGALKSGKLLGAGLDALEEETMAKRPFEGLSNVVLSAHLGGNTADNSINMARRCAEQIAAVSEGRPIEPPHLVNGEFLKNTDNK